jgi:hypothetical protein
MPRRAAGTCYACQDKPDILYHVGREWLCRSCASETVGAMRTEAEEQIEKVEGLEAALGFDVS